MNVQTRGRLRQRGGGRGGRDALRARGQADHAGRAVLGDRAHVCRARKGGRPRQRQQRGQQEDWQRGRPPRLRRHRHRREPATRLSVYLSLSLRLSLSSCSVRPETLTCRHINRCLLLITHLSSV